MTVDVGHEFLKIAVVHADGRTEIVLNEQSQRKTLTAVSFLKQMRSFGDDALKDAAKAPAQVPTFHHSLIGMSFGDSQPDGQWWQRFGLGSQFHPMSLGYDEGRGVPTLTLGEGRACSGEEWLAHVLHFALGFASRSLREAGDEQALRDAVLTLPSSAGMRYRQALIAAGEIAGVRVQHLLHEGTAFALQHSLDLEAGGPPQKVLIYNLGARKVEVTLVQMEFPEGRPGLPFVRVLGSADDYGVGGHLMDLRLAQAMLERFQAERPALAAGIAQSDRALQKLLAQAKKAKIGLSVNKFVHFSVESLYEDTDFNAKVQRSEFEAMCEDLFPRLVVPVSNVLKDAALTLRDVHHVEVVGGAWRVPRVLDTLTNFFAEAGHSTLGQRLNGEEAAALGAANVTSSGAAVCNANVDARSSSTCSASDGAISDPRFSDISSHEYVIEAHLSANAPSRVATFAPGALLGSEKHLQIHADKDFTLLLMEDGACLAEYAISGITGMCLVSVVVRLGHTGIVEVEKPRAKEGNGAGPERSLRIRRSDRRPAPLSLSEVAALKQRLRDVAALEEEGRRGAGLRNELEDAIYSVRHRLESDQLRNRVPAERRATALAFVDEVFEWLEGNDGSPSDYQHYLTGLREQMTEIEEMAAKAGGAPARQPNQQSPQRQAVPRPQHHQPQPAMPYYSPPVQPYAAGPAGAGPARQPNQRSPQQGQPRQQSPASCQAHPRCATLAGDCCPTTSGLMLTCCTR